jgi:hypothetical protein
MKYKSVYFSEGYSGLDKADSNKLQEYFDKDWEYVDSIAQSVSMRGSMGDKLHGSVIVILKKEDKVML